MYSIRATYIPREDMSFDRDYYVKHHIPLAQKQLAGHDDLAPLLPFGQLYGHYNAKGYRLVAEAIAEGLKADGVLQ